MNTKQLSVTLTVKPKPYNKPLLILIYLFGRYMPESFKDWIIKQAFNISVGKVQANGKAL